MSDAITPQYITDPNTKYIGLKGVFSFGELESLIEELRRQRGIASSQDTEDETVTYGKVCDLVMGGYMLLLERKH